MTRHVVLLTNAHEAPAATLTDVLQGAGVAAFFEGIRESEDLAPFLSKSEDDATDLEAPPPIAVLYEVIPGADMRELYSVIEHAHAVWPSAPLVACRRPKDHNIMASLRVLDAATLKRLGFRAIADEPAQLPALLRELEDRGGTGELHAPEGLPTGWLPESLLLPEKISRQDLRAAFELVASLHFTNDQSSAADAALSGLAPLVKADRWTIYLTSETTGNREMNLEPLAVRGEALLETPGPEQDWQRALLGNALAFSGSESKAAKEAMVKTSTVRKTEGGRRVVAIPLVSSERLMGVLEGVRDGAGARSFTKGNLKLLDALA